MTRAFRIAGIAALFACTPMLGHAQSANPITAGISLGASLPSFDDSFDVGFGGALHVYGGSANPESHLKFRGNLSYEKWQGEKAGIKAKARSIGASVEGLFYVGTRDMTIRPYVLAGAGLYNNKSVIKINADIDAERGSTRPAVQAGAGLEFNLSGFSTMLEAKVINNFGESGSQRWIPITFGIHF